MNIGLIVRTVRHLKMTQVVHQILYRLHKHKYVAMEAPLAGERPAGFKTEPIARWTCIEGKVFTFLNLKHEFAGWNFTENGMLWAYNLNYMDWLNQVGSSKEDCCYWIDKFIEYVLHTENYGHTDLTDHTDNFNSTTNFTNYTNNSYQVGLDPYPIALRSINWVKVFCRYPETATKERRDSLYSQVKLLEKKLEYHLLANHLLEDAYAQYIGAAYFGDKRLLKKAKKLLLGQLEEQVLPDGAHYEQSVMYHCILLDRLLDCINISTTNYTNFTNSLSAFAVKMLGHLESVVWEDGSIPMVNDAAYGIAPMPEQIFDYARRLGLKWEAIPMKECGYRKMKNEHMEAIVDVGNIAATYQPGHTHADTFNYELRIDGRPFVVDTGISTYNKTERRQYERGTMAHNCVVVDSQNSSEVWGGFRVGRRATTQLIMDNGQWIIEAVHDGYGKACRRKFEMKEDAFVVEDWYDGEAVSYVHLAEGANEERIAVVGATSIEVKEEGYSTEYNRFRPCKVMAIHFNGKVKYEIR